MARQAMAQEVKSGPDPKVQTRQPSTKSASQTRPTTPESPAFKSTPAADRASSNHEKQWVLRDPTQPSVLLKRQAGAPGTTGDWRAREKRPLSKTRPSSGGKTPDTGYQRSAKPVQKKEAPAASSSIPANLAPVVQPAVGGGGQPLPHLETIQAAFGEHDVSGVKAHVDSESTAALGAKGYATGDHVVFDGSPDLHTAAHEAAHVVQQRAGVHLSTGVSEVGDPYERHADAVAARVVAGQSAADLLSRAPSAAGGQGGVQRQGKGWEARTQSLKGKTCVTNKFAVILVEKSGWKKTGEKIPAGTTVDVVDVNVSDGAVKVSWDSPKGAKVVWTYQYAVKPAGGSKEEDSTSKSETSTDPKKTPDESSTTATVSSAPSKPKRRTGDVKVGTFTKIATELKIRLWGPFKFVAKVEGSWTQLGGVEGIGGDETKPVGDAELELLVYGGLEADFIFFSIFAGVEGKVKFTVDEELALQGPKAALSAGMQDILGWYLARKIDKDLKPKAKQVDGTIVDRKGKIDQEFGRLISKIQSGDWKSQLKDTSWYQFWKSDTVVDKVDDHLAAVEKAVRKAFDKFDVKNDSVERSLARKQVLTQLASVAAAPNREKALEMANGAQKTADGKLDQTRKDFNEVLNQAAKPENKQEVGFDGSLIFKAGGKAQLTKKVGIEVTGGMGWQIEDKKGATDWNTDVEDVQTYQIKATIGNVELSGSYEQAGQSVKLGLSIMAEKAQFATGALKGDPETARDFGNRFATGFKTVTQGQPATTPKEALSGLGKGFVQLFKDKDKETKVGSKGSAKGGVDLNVEIEIQKDPSTGAKRHVFKSAAIKITWVASSLTLQGGAGIVEIKGELEQGGFLELTVSG